jgi:hypothetical protein
MKVLHSTIHQIPLACDIVMAIEQDSLLFVFVGFILPGLDGSFNIFDGEMACCAIQVHRDKPRLGKRSQRAPTLVYLLDVTITCQPILS